MTHLNEDASVRQNILFRRSDVFTFATIISSTGLLTPKVLTQIQNFSQGEVETLLGDGFMSFSPDTTAKIIKGIKS